MSSRASVNGVSIAYDDHGVGLPVLFLHAFPLNKNMWHDTITALLAENRYRLVAPDWRGFGESEIVAEVSTMEDFADDLAGLMDTLGIDAAVLCGLSMGGYAAFAFLRKYPQRVAGLILADTRPGADSDEVRANRERIAQMAESQGTGAIADLQIPRLISEDTRQHSPDVELHIRQMIDASTPQGIAAASRGMGRRVDSSDLLARITCPTLVLVGERDELTTPDMARDYAARIPGAQFIVIPYAGHLSNLEQPQSFLQAVSGFLRSEF